MLSLEDDIIREIMGRMDGITLANAGCVCSEFRSIAEEEIMWEKACCSLWQSTAEKDVKELISSSLGGFRKFYANSFPLFTSESGHGDSNCREFHTVLPSDFVSVVDVEYMNMAIFSKVIWGIPCADDFEGWFSKCPFRMDLIDYSMTEAEEEDQTGLPSISMSGEKHLKDGELWVQLMGNMRLSWIMINKRTGHVANLSSWSPLAGKRNWCSDKDFVMHFGCILPAYNILPCKVAQCSIAMKCRVWDSDPASFKITEISMQLEDVMGCHLQGRSSLLIIDNALGCSKRSKDHRLIVESYEKYLVEQAKLREVKMRKEGRLETLCSITAILAFASFWYLIFTGRGVIF